MISRKIALVFVLSLLTSTALAAGTQTTTISSTTPTNLGVAPVVVQTLNQPVNVCVADSTPTAGTWCNTLQPGPPVVFNPADASSYVYAALLGSSSLIAYTPVYSSGVAGSVTQGTSPWVISGTVGVTNLGSPFQAGGSIGNTAFGVAPYTYTTLGCQQITSLASAAPFASVPTGAKLALVTPEVQPVRYRDDGTAPTAAIGPLLYPGLVWSYSGALSAIQFIQTAASATLDVCFYK